MSQAILKSGVGIIALIIAGKILGLLKDVVISATFGTGAAIDAYFMAMNISTVFFAAFTTTITLVFLPLYHDRLLNRGESEASIYANSILNVFAIISCGFMLVLITFAPQIMSAIDLSSATERRDISIIALRLMATSYVFSTITTFLTSMQLARKSYFYLHFVPIISNMMVILAALFFASQFGVYAIIIAGVLAWIIQIPFHSFITRKYFSYRAKINLSKADLAKLGLLIVPAFLGLLADQLNVLVTTILVTSLDLGAISALNYAYKLILLASGTFVVAVMTMMFPLFSEHAAKRDMDALSSAVKRGIRLICLIMVPITAVTLFYHQDIVSIVFERGAFSREDTLLTSPILFYFAFGLIFMGLREVLNKAFYALKRTTLPLYVSLFSVGLNIPLSLLWIKSMQANGLALAVSVSIAFCVLCQFFFLRREIGPAFYKGLFPFFLRLCLAAIIAIIILYGCQTALQSIPTLLRFMVASGLAIGGYGIALWILRIEELDLIKRRL
ncbi:murein biosynthesis integral membrane protein MurJ [Litorimonas taeanensis]|uniref:Lipid II flippase n=1 Tax=Litorimonas taeanensis TaxID=568099 RepID=A0A420WDN0_9PROT|nr:murein biosynthesis integral membrane protein MurJ [Litorimonas taeanensis]RKQ69088.1 murein biosynthesis integral membrane protein MurJ [Litorimonas taeanensis]